MFLDSVNYSYDPYYLELGIDITRYLLLLNIFCFRGLHLGGSKIIANSRTDTRDTAGITGFDRVFFLRGALVINPIIVL